MDMTRGTLITTASLAEMPDFAVGAARVCPATRTIEGPGGSVQVEPRVMQVLIVLADAAGAVVTRDTLLTRCWGGVYVGDESLNRAIAGVRRIASGIAAGSFQIETIPRTGYRLISSQSDAPAPTAVREKLRPERSPGGFDRRWVLGGGLAAVAGVALWSTRPAPAERVARLMEDSQIAMHPGTPEKSREAIAMLREAVALAPGNAQAWGLLALTMARADEHSFDTTISPAGEVERAAKRALQLDKDNADASAALAITIPYYGDWLAAERRFDAVLEHHPDHLFTRDSLSFFLSAVGRIREASLNRIKFIREDGFDAGLQFRRIYALWFLGRIAEADQVAARGLEMWPGHTGLWFGRLWLLAGTGRIDRALAHVADLKSRPRMPEPIFKTLQVGLAAAKTRNPAEVHQAVQMIMAGVTHSVAAVVNAMMLLNLMGATDEAFELSRAYYLEEGPIIAAMEWRPGQPVVPDQRRRKTSMLFTPTVSAMQRDPRFMPLMEQMGLTDYWRRRGVVPDFLANLSA